MIRLFTALSDIGGVQSLPAIHTWIQGDPPGIQFYFSEHHLQYMTFIAVFVDGNLASNVRREGNSIIFDAPPPYGAKIELMACSPKDGVVYA